GRRQYRPSGSGWRTGGASWPIVLVSIRSELKSGRLTMTPERGSIEAKKTRTSLQRQLAAVRIVLTRGKTFPPTAACFSLIADSSHNVTMKLGRNDPCWCGSGKKFK